ncbi:hypothetical protein CRG98_003169 [Punica granatum]|uniref:Uncharacterized protein n=1 Tax=Punica granatum TaxID=22663 RepID=A0A2I0L6X4_PUNGR|nr:hypothetical protein CRG98_003169 [Punica granatum]
MDVEEKELEAECVGADDLLESLLESTSTADGSVRVALDHRLVHPYHYPRRLALHHLSSLSLSVDSLTELKLHRIDQIWRVRNGEDWACLVPN